MRMSEDETNVGSPAEKDRTQSEGSDTEFDVQFKPIITLPEVEVITNEENETVILNIRAKLYRFDSVCDPPEWKERGTGELKLLKHNETSSMRIVMRRDKTLKVCANHFITPWMELKPSVSCEKAFVYTVLADFAEERPKSECLAVKFATIENASLFKSKFEEAKVILTTECYLYNGKGDQENESEEENENVGDDKSKHESENENFNEVTKKISELEVSVDKK